MYSTANERGYISSAGLFAFRQNAGGTPAIRWSRLLFRNAGVSPACGCIQPQMSEVLISSAFLFAYRQSAGETPAIRWSRLLFRIAGVSPASGCTQPQMSEVI
ncbi:MAG: hypothetical protein LBP59_13955, partial [Planctomycetaceae bacterium]|nr:hypothetical protein [Planctomycetaceae bacterium]